jgi:hypothetical protein
MRVINVSRLPVRVEHIDQRQDVVRSGRRTDLHPDRVADLADQLHVRAVEVAGAFTDPDEVCGDVVRRVGARVDAGHRPLVLEQQSLVAAVHLHRAELVGVDTAGGHELHGPVDLPGQRLVPPAGRAGRDEVLVPQVHLAQVRVATGGESPHEVQGRRGHVVHAQQPSRVRDPGRLGELSAVDRIASIGGQFLLAPLLHRCRPRLGVLTGKPPELDHRHAARIGEHGGHLQQRPQLAPQRVGAAGVERLGAVPALKQERLAPCHRRQALLQQVALAGEHQRRQRAQLGGDLGDGVHVRIVRLLQSGQPAPGVEVDTHR